MEKPIDTYAAATLTALAATVCSNAQVRTDRLDEVVWREAECLLRDPARIATEYQWRLADARRRGHDGPNLAAVELGLSKNTVADIVRRHHTRSASG